MKTDIYTQLISQIKNSREAPGIALVAHDACKHGMLEWARFNGETLSSYTLYTTGCNRVTADFLISSPLFANSLHNIESQPEFNELLEEPEPVIA